ncbi:fluoride efflux transporter CrcB [Fontivita pretiosa]|uniref:fluoride efflux transporter CrcB n=1 Tax=Fontivita pretiosa TaxID=2989684 RepID=UPI003D1698E9
MKLLIQYLAIGCAGFLGAIARYFVSTTCGRLFGTAFPIGTFVINVSGSLLLGWFVTFVGNRMVVSDTTRLAIGVGFVGAYTTFSTFMYESDGLLQRGAGLEAMFNLLGSLMAGLVAVRVGIWLGSD